MTIIPKITPETVFSVTTSMEHDADEYFNKFVQKIRKENILVYELIRVVYSNTLSGEHEKTGDAYMRGVCTAYKLIESQMEGDEMNKVWGGKK